MTPIASEQRFSWLDIFAGASAKVGGRVDWADESGSAGLLVLPGERRLFFHKGVLDINGIAAARVAKDKHFTSQFLRSRGYQVPEESSFFQESYARRCAPTRGPAAATAYASTLGYPVYVKPVHLSQGRGVAKVSDPAELTEAIADIQGKDTVYLVQRSYDGTDIRAIAVHGEILFGFERSPLAVVGDGASSVAQLLKQRQREFVESGRDTLIDLTDWRLHSNLRRSGLNMDDVVPEGRTVRLHDIANLTCGGIAYDRTEAVRASLADTVRRIARDLRLGFCGIDFIISDTGGAVVLEVNSAPGLDHYLYSNTSPLDQVQKLYADLLRAYMSSCDSWWES